MWVTGFFAYCFIAWLSYSQYKDASWYYYAGLFFALISNFIWLTISKQTDDASQLMIKGLYWDAMLTFTYLAVPLLFFEARLTTYQAVGFILTLLGLFLTKI